MERTEYPRLGREWSWDLLEAMFVTLAVTEVEIVALLDLV
jgi:hypothetical protein